MGRGTTLLRQSIRQILTEQGLGSTGKGRPTILVVIHWPTREVRELRYPDVLETLTSEELDQEIYVFRVTIP